MGAHIRSTMDGLVIVNGPLEKPMAEGSGNIIVGMACINASSPIQSLVFIAHILLSMIGRSAVTIIEIGAGGTHRRTNRSAYCSNKPVFVTIPMAHALAPYHGNSLPSQLQNRPLLADDN